MRGVRQVIPHRKIRQDKCHVCGRRNFLVPFDIQVCGEHLRELHDKGLGGRITRHIPMGGFCDLHGKVRWNVSSINL